MESAAKMVAEESQQKGEVPHVAQEAVLVHSAPLPDDAVVVRGYDFSDGPDYNKILGAFKYTGFQATSFGMAVDEINRMINWRLSDEPISPEDDMQDPEERKNVRCKIFLGYTSNLISAGTRECIRYLVQNRMVDVIVTSAGGVEEDFIKCLANTYLGDFSLKGEDLRRRGMNRIGNLLVPNDNYCKFEDWVMPILDQMLKEQNELGINWTPSKLIHRLGKEINHEDSVYYWAYKHDIPVFCPALTDGSLGDMIYFHSYKNPGLRIDLVEDIRAVNMQSVYAKKTGMIILGGGVVKHHICNSNLMRNGADYAVFLNTGQEFDGSDAGARPDEAISWGKIRLGAKPVKIYADASLIFPLLVAQTFATQFKPKP